MSSEQAGGTPGSGAVSDRMRALLARAAEEQLLEQRQVSSVLGELRALVEDVDERLATGEQVDRVAEEVRALSARVEARLDATEARSAELAERITEATTTVGQAAQDLVEAVVAGVAERVEAQLRELTTSTTASVEAGERRLATHVDDAVLALAEVVLRRRSAQPAPPAAPPAPEIEDDPPGEPVVPPSTGADVEQDVVSDDLPTGPPAQGAPTPDVPEPTAPAEDGAAPPVPEPRTADDADEDVPPAAAETAGTTPLVDPATDGLVPASGATPPGDGFVLVPADVAEPDAGPAPPVQQERRTAERRTSDRSDGSGRRRRPWWRPV